MEGQYQMTTPTKLVPLWTDQRISDYAGNSPTAWEARRMYDAMRKVRDDYQKSLNEYQAAYE